MTNKVPNQEQLFQPPTTSNLNNDKVLFKCPKFTYKVPPNLTIPISSKPLVSAAPITQNASRLDCSIAPLTTSTQKDNSISPRNLNNLSVKPFNHGTRFLPAGKHASQRSTQENPKRQQNKIESLDSESIIRVSKSRSKLGSSLKKLKKPRGVVELCRQKKPAIAHEMNQFSDTNVLRGNNNRGPHPLNRDNESNRVSKEEGSDDYYFGEYNSASGNLLDKSVVEERTKKAEPCEIDIKMSEPSEEGKSVKTRGSKGKGISENEDIDEDKNDDCWDSDNETVVEDYKKSIEVENVCNKLWEERVAALVGKKKKKIFQSQESLDEVCEAWLEKVSSFKQGIKSFSQQIQENSKDSSSQLAVSILEGEEQTETIRGLQIRTSGHLRLRNIEANLKF
ncbi:31927_t:CDS:2 [Gigaspora margarita]|uniref:31927_t:CDS:1 n=1 Tax=Gigaspora margarita TaxID=4874 RepID=A0ABN7VIX1_GIGMA|nr:31927_t:CDS:2 [Gigaspora margarita]